MKFNELDKRMRVYETAHDVCVIPGIEVVARVDGRGFTGLTERMGYKKPYDPAFHEAMRETMCWLVTHSGFRIMYGYAQSDEINLWLSVNDDLFNHKERKINSILASGAGAFFTKFTGEIGTFDCRVSQLPNPYDVVDYFRWRQADAQRNCLNAHLYWYLRNVTMMTGSQADRAMRGRPNKEKSEALRGTRYDHTRAEPWMRNGVGVSWKTVVHTGVDPRTGEETQTTRFRIHLDEQLPVGEDYAEYLENVMMRFENPAVGEPARPLAGVR